MDEARLEELLKAIPLHLATFPDFKDTLIEQSGDHGLDVEQVKQIVGIIEAKFLKPLAQIVDEVLLCEGSQYLQNASVQRDAYTKLEKQRDAYEEQKRVMEQNYTTQIKTLERKITETLVDVSEEPEDPQQNKRKRFLQQDEPMSVGKFSVDQFVETVIRYGADNEDVWISARVKEYHGEDCSYDLVVADPVRYNVNPTAVHVPEELIREKHVAVAEVNEKGCYLTISPEAEGTLWLNWSENHVDGAFMFFRPKKKVPAFRYKRNRGREELTRQCGGVRKKRLYAGYIEFFKLAQHFCADLYIYPEQHEVLDQVKFVVNNSHKLFFCYDGEFFDTTGAETVACVRKVDRSFDGISGMLQSQFLSVGNRVGCSTTLQGGQQEAPKKKKRRRRKKPAAAAAFEAAAH